jgi:hypothetical protein
VSSVCCLGPARISSFLFFAGLPSRNIPSSGVVSCCSLRVVRWGEVSAGAKRPEVRSARRKGIEVLHGYAHFDIAIIGKWAFAVCVEDVLARRCWNAFAMATNADAF